mmetsp:Transcript_35372/g.101600  ORF Transcript_35372/g.101600 Transcript_35372/m.101600 type:complete len:438 (+) Transcript_35372:110-1423(+)
MSEGRPPAWPAARPQRGHRAGPVHGGHAPSVHGAAGRRAVRVPVAVGLARVRPVRARASRGGGGPLGRRWGQRRGTRLPLVEDALGRHRLVVQRTGWRGLRTPSLALLRIREPVLAPGVLLVERRNVAWTSQAHRGTTRHRSHRHGGVGRATRLRYVLRAGLRDCLLRRALRRLLRRGRAHGGLLLVALLGAKGEVRLPAVAGQKRVGILVAQLVLNGEVHLLGYLVLADLLAHVDADAHLVATVDVQSSFGVRDHAGDTFHGLELLYDLPLAVFGDAVPPQVELPQVRQAEGELQQQVQAAVVQAVVREADDEDLVCGIIVLQQVHHLVHLALAEAQAVQVHVTHEVPLDEVHDIPQQRPRLEGLEHLRPAEEGHVPLPEGRDQPVRLREVAEVHVGALLPLVQHGEQLRDLLHHGWDRVAGLLRLIEELVDLQLL